MPVSYSGFRAYRASGSSLAITQRGDGGQRFKLMSSVKTALVGIRDMICGRAVKHMVYLAKLLICGCSKLTTCHVRIPLQSTLYDNGVLLMLSLIQTNDR